MSGPHVLPHEEVLLRTDDVELEGSLDRPRDARGLVLFAHGSGSSRFSPRNRRVAETLQEASLATLLFDLLAPDEAAFDERTRALRFDIELLSRRLIGAVDWVRREPGLEDLRIGLFGSSTGSAAALIAAAERPREVRAVVSRGGRPDLAGDWLRGVEAPTLLIVGERDEPVLAMHQPALAQLGCDRRLEIVPGATHLFEEPGALDRVAALAADWFREYLGGVDPDLEGRGGLAWPGP